MKQNLFNKLWLRVGMIVAIMTTALSGTAWADTATITFANQTSGTSDGSSAYSTSTFVSSGIANSDAAFGTITCSATTKCYSGKTGHGLKAGASSSAGSFTIAFSTPLTNVTKITLNRASYSDSKTATITVKNGEATLAENVSTPSGSADFADMDITGLSIASLSGLTVETSKYCYIKSITVTYSTGSSSAVATTTAIDHSGITNTDVYTSTTAGSLSATVTSGGNAISNATVTWSGNNDAVATINESTGAVTLVSAGTVTFTALYAGQTGVYQPSSADYEMTVTSTAPYVQPTTVEITPNYDFWGQTAQFSGSTYSNLSGSQDNVSLAWSRGTGSTYANTTAMRFYKDNTLTFTAPTGYEIKSIVLAVSGTYSDLTFSPSGYDSENTTWSGSSSTVTMSRPSNGSSYATISKFTITIGQASTDPSISADNVEIAYNATEGSIAFTVTNPVDGGQVSATTEANWLTSGSATSTSPISFTCSANSETTARTATVTLTYTYNSSETVTTTVTVTQAAAPESYTTIPALFAAATSTETGAYVTFNNWVVSGVSTNGKNVFVTDNAGNGFVIYSSSDQSSTYAVGNILSGTAVTCGLKKYNGFAELLNVDASDLTITTGGTVTAANVAMADLAGVNTGALVSYENLTCSVSDGKYYLSDGTTTLQVYNTLYAFDALEADKTYNITGIYEQFNSTKEILPRSAADIVEVVITTPAINVASTTIDASYAVYNGTINITYENFTPALSEVFFCDVNGDAATYDWITAVISNENIEYHLNENTGAARTAYMKVYALDNEANELYSELITINQAALPSGDQYALFTGALVEGDYIIYYDGKAMNTTVNNDRLQYEEVTPESDIITTDDATIVWHIAPSGNYWTIYNAESNAYAASTGVKNKAQMLADGTDDKALWTVSGTETYEFVNKKNTANEVNANLRENGTYGFACYATSTGGALTLYKKVVPATVPVALNAYGYTTFSSNYAVSIPENGDFTAWQITNIDNDNKITFVQVTGNVKAETGLFLKGDANDEITIETAASGAELQDNILVGFPTATNVTAGEYYGLSGNQFKKVGTGTVKAGKALLPAGYITESNSVKPFTFVFEEDDATAIEMVNGQSSMVNGPIYNVAGQRISKMQKGINIVNGKKILK